MGNEIIDRLDKAAQERPGELIRSLCVSLASFIAEIDSSSDDVATYLEQRLGPVLRAAYHHGGIRELERAVEDVRKLDQSAKEAGRQALADWLAEPKSDET